MNKIDTISYQIGQTPKTSQFLRDKDSKETTTSREIDFSKWVKGYGSETTSNEGQVWENRSRANDPESPESYNETCMDLSVEEILDVDYLPTSKLPTIDTFLAAFPHPSGGETIFLSLDSYLAGHDPSDDQEPSLEEAVSATRQTEPDLSTMGHKEWPLVEPLLSTEGESTANRTSQKFGTRARPKKALNSIIFILMNRSLNIPLPENENFSKMTAVYEYFRLWQKDGVLKSVLALLEEEAEEPLKSHYGSLVKNFQEASNCEANRASLESLRLEFDEPFKLSFQGVTNEQWLLIEPLLNKKRKLEHCSISDREWAFVEPLLSTKVENRTNQRPRKALNSLLLVLMSGTPNIPPLPKDPNFCGKRTVYEYFKIWQEGRFLESVLALLEKGAQEPLKSHYGSLVKNFQEASNCEANRASLDSLRLKFDEPVKLSFQGVTNEQWLLIQPLLSEAAKRPALSLIFSLLINEASSFASSNVPKKNEATEYLALWKKDGTLKNVLTRLIEVKGERGQSDYQKMLNHLQNLTVQPIPQLQPQPTSNEECDLMTDDQSDLDHQGPSLPQAVKRREDDPELWRISDREWNVVEPLFSKEVKGIGKPRKALNSLLFILINGDSTPLPKNPDFSTKGTAEVYFVLWQTNEVLEEVLPLLQKKSQKPLQSYYRKLLKNLQEIPNRKARPLSISNFKKKFGQAGSGFQGVTDKQWTSIDPLLNEKIIKCGRHHRRDLNSIFSVVIKEVPIDEIPVTSNFSGRSTFYKNFTVWKKDETLKKVLIQLIKGAQGTTLQSDYRKALDKLYPFSAGGVKIKD